MQDIIFVEEVLKDSDKANVVHIRHPMRYKSSRI